MKGEEGADARPPHNTRPPPRVAGPATLKEKSKLKKPVQPAPFSIVTGAPETIPVAMWDSLTGLPL